MKDAQVTQLSELKFRKQLAYVGLIHKGDKSFDVTKDVIVHWAQETNAMIKDGIEVPLAIEHTVDPEKRRGTVTSFETGLDSKGRFSLFQIAEFRDAEAAKLIESDVSLYSPPYIQRGGKIYRRPVTHVAITDYPVVTDLDDWEVLVASVSEGSMLKDLAEALGIEVLEDADDEAIKKLIIDAFAALKEKPSKKDGEEPEVSASILGLMRDNRILKIDNLLNQGKITSHVATKLKGQFCSDTALALAHSSGDGFDTTLGILIENDPVKFRSMTGSQSARKKSSLVESAEKRASK